MPSKLITIKKSATQLGARPQEAVELILGSSKWSVGSYYEGNGSKKIASGLNDAEIRLLLPCVILYPKSDPAFYKEVERYYKEIYSTVDSDGLVLEIGLEKDNDLPVSEDNMPINVEHYLKYRHHEKHPAVAANAKIALSNPLVRFYIEDKQQSIKLEKEVADAKDEATKLYFELKDDSARMRTILVLLNERLSTIPSSLDERRLLIKRISEERPNEFLKAVKDKKAEIKVLIREGLSIGYLEELSNNYIVLKETQSPLGFGLEDSAIFLQDKKNADILARLKNMVAAKTA